MGKIVITFQKSATKKILLNVSLLLLAFVYLYLTVQKFKITKNILNLVLFIDRFAQMLINVFILKIYLLLRFKKKPTSKYITFIFLIM